MSYETVIVGALATGLFGAVHCAGMCGPLVVGGCEKQSGWRGAPGYFAGRLVSYTLLGAIAGHLGQHALCIMPMSAANAVAVALTALPALVRAIVLLRAAPRQDTIPLRRKPGSQPQGTLRRAFAAFVAHVPRRGLGLGLATAALPCGLLLSGVAMSAAAGSAIGGATAMAALSIGTAPGLIVPLVGRGLLTKWLANRGPRIETRRKIEAALWLGLAAWMAIRLTIVGPSCHTPMP